MERSKGIPHTDCSKYPAFIFFLLFTFHKLQISIAFIYVLTLKAARFQLLVLCMFHALPDRFLPAPTNEQADVAKPEAMRINATSFQIE